MPKIADFRYMNTALDFLISIKITALTWRAVKSVLFDKLEFVYFLSIDL